MRSFFLPQLSLSFSSLTIFAGAVTITATLEHAIHADTKTGCLLIEMAKLVFKGTEKSKLQLAGLDQKHGKRLLN